VVATAAWVWLFALLSSLGPSSIGLEKTGDVEKGTLFVTFAMMLTGIVQAILFLSQLRIMNQSLNDTKTTAEATKISAEAAKDAAHAAQDQAETARRALVAANRPWVAVAIDIVEPLLIMPGGAAGNGVSFMSVGVGVSNRAGVFSHTGTASS
jgi:hypothetical protein